MRANRRGTGPVDFADLSAAKEASNSSATTPTDPEQTDLSTIFANVTVRTPRNQSRTVSFKNVVLVLVSAIQKYSEVKVKADVPFPPMSALNL